MATLSQAEQYSSTGESVPARDEKDELMRIGEMAAEYGVTLRTLRFYEDRGLISPIRDGSTRLYTRRDRARLRLVLLGRKVGFSLREVKKLLDLYDPHGTNVRQMRVALDKSERQLARLRQQREMLDDAIAELNGLTENIRGELEAQLAVRRVD